MDLIRHLFRHYTFGAVALVTVLTLAIVGAVVLTTTSAGCGTANRVGLRLATCITGGPVAHVGQPSPTPGKGLQETPPPPTYNPPTSVPYYPPASNNPPYNPAESSGAPPYAGPESGSTPPLVYPGSAGYPAPSTLALSCRLPVYAGGPGSGGFIVFPGQNFIADPRSAVTAPSPSPGGATPTPPQGWGPGYPAGWYGLTYDAGYAKWLPVPYAWVSPDGRHYAYPLGGDIYVQNVTNGTQLDLAEGKGFWMLDAENDGAYVTLPNQAGLWFLAYSGTTTQISTTGFWQGVANGAAYGTPTSQVPSGATNTINKLDFKTGTTTPFFTLPGSQSNVTGFDGQGHPVIQASYNGGQALYVATGPGLATAIASNTWGYNSGPFPNGTPIADSHGLWFSVGNGVVLFQNNTWYWMASIGGQLAGQCL